MRRTRLLLAILLLFTALSGHSEQTVHVLQRGETIYTLARQYGVDADTLLTYNDIDDPTRLPVGAIIRIPGTYIVKEGEYVYSIAQQLNVNWLELLATNGLGQDDVVRPGDVLLVPIAATALRDSGQENTTGTTERTVSEPGTGTAAENTDSSGSTTAGDAAATESTTGTVVALPGAGTLLWPHPGERENYDGRFRGVIMAGQLGDTFRSVTSGVVSFVGPFTSFGKLILVRAENGYLYGYAGADRVDVRLGDRINNGTVLGSVGVSPAFQSAQVLFTVWRDNRYIDPENAPRG